MELLTDKNKTKFDIYLYDNFDKFIIIDEINNYLYSESEKTAYDIFELLPFEMQIGVLLAYYDSLGIRIDVGSRQSMPTYDVYVIKKNGYEYNKFIGNYESRNEAYKQAFKKANDLINKQ